MRSILRSTGLAAALVLAGACDSSTTTTTRSVRALGFLEFNGATGEVTVPVTVVAGQNFTVLVVTRGSGCTIPGDTELTQSGANVDIFPYDVTTDGDDVTCPSVVQNLVHQSSLRFETTGEKFIRVHGRRHPGNESITITRTVTVQVAP